jgi:membrane-bound serine protease (ClpP class)
LIVESLVPSFGVFGIGGVAAFVIGSIFLFNNELNHLKF